LEKITAVQYGYVVTNLVNDDDGCFQREMAEAFTKEPRVFALSAERQEEMLAWIRKTMLVSTQWPEIKKQLTKWLDTPAPKREPAEDTDDVKPKTKPPWAAKTLPTVARIWCTIWQLSALKPHWASLQLLWTLIFTPSRRNYATRKGDGRQRHRSPLYSVVG
jgi:hypothetical protein